MRFPHKPALLLALSVFAFQGCSKDSKPGGPDTPPAYSVLRLDLYDTAPLPVGYAYQLWLLPRPAIRADVSVWSPKTQFRTLRGPSGQPDTLVTLAGQRIARNDLTGLADDLADFDSLMITIEQAGGSPTMPSETVYLNGAVPDFDSTVFGALHFPISIGGGIGQYTLASPTDSDSLNETSGIWFMRPFQPPLTGLEVLPADPPGWKYEGWVFHQDRWLSTGKFTDPSANDEFDGFSASVNAPPPFPGEDFLVNPPPGVNFPWILVAADSVAVTMEPNPDTDETAPFGLRLLEAEIGEPLTPGVLRVLNPVDNAAPGGNAVFRRPDAS